MSASLRASVSTSSAAATSRARRTAASRGRPAAASASATAAPPVSAPEAIVVGGGVGGLAIAGRLARAGYAVTLLEKNAEVGGRLQSYNPPDAPGWRFDTGPSLLLFPDKYRECFEALGERMEDHLDVVRVSPAYRAHFGDGTSFDLSYDMARDHSCARRRAAPNPAPAPSGSLRLTRLRRASCAPSWRLSKRAPEALSSTSWVARACRWTWACARSSSVTQPPPPTSSTPPSCCPWR